jgi:hypothetical protein
VAARYQVGSPVVYCSRIPASPAVTSSSIRLVRRAEYLPPRKMRRSWRSSSLSSWATAPTVAVHRPKYRSPIHWIVALGAAGVRFVPCR